MVLLSDASTVFTVVSMGPRSFTARDGRVVEYSGATVVDSTDGDVFEIPVAKGLDLPLMSPVRLAFNARRVRGRWSIRIVDFAPSPSSEA